MKILLPILLWLAFPLASSANDAAGDTLTVAELKRCVTSYLDETGAVPPPREAVKMVYLFAYVHGMISGLELADTVIEQKQPILQRFKSGDPKAFFRDLGGYLERMKNLDPAADGYKVLGYFLLTNYTENPSVKLKATPLIMEALGTPAPKPAEDKAPR